MEQVLIITGLTLSFLGSFFLMIDSLFLLQKPNVSTIHRKGFRPLEPQKSGNYKSVLISKQELRRIIWMVLITSGFLFQLIGNLYQP